MNQIRNTSSFSEETFSLLKATMNEIHAESGTHLFWEGDEADKLYYVVEGRVKITKSSDEGRQFIIDIYHTGDMFGQIDPYQASKHWCNAEVMETATIGIIQKKDLVPLLRQHGDVAVEVMNWMGLSHRMTLSKLRDLMMFGKTGALCSLLIRLHNTYGEKHPQGVFITKRLTNLELADMIGATRESVNRLLSDFKSRDIIANEGGHIIVKDLQYLKDICHCENCPADICRI